MRMPDDDQRLTQPAPKHVATPASAATPVHGIFHLPPAVKRVFDKFPLTTYEANELPQRAPFNRTEHVLHIFTTQSEARLGGPSYNPACLKWQTYLKFARLQFAVVASSNHASPSGVLPFLQPANKDDTARIVPPPVPSNKLRKWMASSQPEEPDDIRYEAYASLLDGRIRKAWLFQMYLTPQNSGLVHQLYIEPCSSHLLVQFAIAHQLRSAAESELVKSAHSTHISAMDLIGEAEEACNALSTLLGSGDWFFGKRQPSFFDASVFAYTHLILNLGWKYNPLGEVLSKHENLLQHQHRIWRGYFIAGCQ